MDVEMGFSTPISYVPHYASKYTYDMTYFQRCYNTILHYYEEAIRRFSYIPAQNRLAKTYFRKGIESAIPHLLHVQRNISVILTNTNQALQLHPQVGAQVNVGGMHLTKSNPLPNNLLVSTF
jgi:glucuronosyltransferase